ncbi:MAG: type IV pilin, partial [Nanoarchaeota archaeon]|nr:type IV pilin [Nanoarchaeota archaeon]
MNKRGISAVVATVLMILLTIVAIGIIWLSMVKIVDSEFEDPTARVEIVTSEGYTFYDKANKTICVQVTRSSSDLDL